MRLPQATEDFLVDNKVERVVVIVGGTSAVSADIEEALVEDVGVVNKAAHLGRLCCWHLGGDRRGDARRLRGMCWTPTRIWSLW